MRFIFVLSLTSCTVSGDLVLPDAAEGAPPDAALSAADADSLPRADTPQEFHIRPSATSLPGLAAIGDTATFGQAWAPDDPHYVYRSAVGAERALVVFFPGCGGKPAAYTTFYQAALAQGYHVIGLDYPNACSVGDACGGDLACIGTYRSEVVFGGDTSDPALLAGHPQDAINRRLKALLVNLRERDPEGAWDDFIEDDASAVDGLRLRFDRVVVAGHSLGAGYAAFVAKQFTVRRVNMFAGSADAADDCTGMNDPACRDTDPTVAPWLDEHATPSSSYFGLAHQDDFADVNRLNRILANWAALAVPTGQEVVSDAACAAPGCNPHGTVVGDQATYGATWATMLGTP